MLGYFRNMQSTGTYIEEKVSSLAGKMTEQPKVLNLFAYTGGASLAAKAAGGDVTHLDSVRQVVSWRRDNMELSGLDHIRWW
jgi:23S rRNA (cytosine1962-C5)-methyltransferase